MTTSSPPPARAFPFVPMASTRSKDKPRKAGLTMVVDMGIPLGQLADTLELAGDYVDLGKVATGSAALYRDDVLARKLAIYKEHGVATFLGGQFLELIVHAQGWDAVPQFLDEAVRIGIDAIEVSDNIVPLTLDEQVRLVGMIAEKGLAVHGEVGSKTGKQDPAELIAQAKALLDAGCAEVLVEAAEMVDETGKVLPALAEAVMGELPPEAVIFELPGPWIKGVGPSGVYEMMKFLVTSFGPNVSIGNVWPDQVMILEAMRNGLGAAGPLDLIE